MLNLTQAQRAEIEHRLLSRERELEVGLDRGQEKREARPTPARELQGAGDASVVAMIQQAGQAGNGRDANELRTVAAVLARITGPSYGWCIDCGAPIPFDRLLAHSAALRCARDQLVNDRNHGRNVRT